MALTVNSSPYKIDNSGVYNITTSLVEDSTHVNLRIRASIYTDGIVRAMVEKPKGVSDFNFADILKSLSPTLNFNRGTGETVQTGSVGANLITDWAVNSGTYVGFSHLVNVISAAHGTVLSTLETNAITVAPGELYLFYSPDYVCTGTPISAAFQTGEVMDGFEANKGILIMPTVAGSYKIVIGYVTNQNFSGTFYLFKITTNRSTIGGGLLPYLIKFYEVYEDASGVTQTGSPITTNVMRFVSAKGDDITFQTYNLQGSLYRFSNKTIRNNITKFYTYIPKEYWIVFYTEYCDIELYYSVDGGAYNHTIHPICYEGWGVIILNVGGLMAGAVTSMAFYMKERSASAATISETVTIYIDSVKIEEREVIEYDGITGGKEYLPFEGLKDQQFTTVRSYRTGANKNRMPLSFQGTNRQKLETRFKDINNTEYLKSLLISEDVKKLEPLNALPTDVIVITDTVKISGSDLFTNQIDIEYEY